MNPNRTEDTVPPGLTAPLAIKDVRLALAEAERIEQQRGTDDADRNCDLCQLPVAGRLSDQRPQPDRC